MRSVLRKHSASILVAVLTAVLVAAPATWHPDDGSKGSVASAQTTLTNCPAPTVNNIPCIKYGFKDGPVPLPGTPTTIATLPLAKGKYVINAKLYVQNYRGYTTLSLSAACQLVAGPNFDWAKESIPPTNSNGIQQDLDSTMSLTVANTFTTAGTVELKCSGETFSGDPGVSAHFIKITAQKVGTLIRVNM